MNFNYLRFLVFFFYISIIFHFLQQICSMRSFQNIFIVTLALICCSIAKNLRQTLSYQNIDSFLLQSEAYISIINFVVPNCDECDLLQQKINTIIGQEKDYITLSSVNCELEAKLCQTMKVTQKPFIMIFDENKRAKYEYPGKLQSIEITQRKIVRSIKQLESQIKLQNKINQTRTENIRSQQQSNKSAQKEDNNTINEKFNKYKSNSKLLTKSILLIISLGILVALVFRQLYNIFLGKNSLLLDVLKPQAKNMVSIRSNKIIESQQQVKSNKNIPIIKSNNNNAPKF